MRSGTLLLAFLDDAELGRQARDCSREFEKIRIDLLQPNLMKLVAGSPEDEGPAGCRAAAPAAAAGQPSCGGDPDAGTRSVHDQPHRAGEQGRDRPGHRSGTRSSPDGGHPDPPPPEQSDPHRRGRRRQDGRGRGAGPANCRGRCSSALKNVAIRTLDLGLLQAGAGVKGEFENRLKQVISEVEGSPVPIILFIDEAHTMIGAGGAAGQGDAANLLKPALARGELRTIAATTWAEYKKYFEKDAALARRFQVVKVEEPSEEVAIRMMPGLTAIFEKHHDVRILEEAVESSVKLSHRYIPARSASRQVGKLA